MVWLQMIDRKRPETMSAAPAKTRQNRVSHSVWESPTPTMPRPQSAAAMSTMRPCRCTRPVQPEPIVAISEPAAGAA